MDNISFILTDTHFGVKQNSMTWLNSQLDFFYNQLIPHIEQYKNNYNIKLIHMGDVFDSRSTISTYVAVKVVKLFEDLSKLCDVHIIAGNHDFYSPNSDIVNSLDLLLNHSGVILHTNKAELIDGDLFIPWYEWGSQDTKNLLKKGVNNIYAHTDIVTEPIPYTNINNIKLFSGHLHIPYINRNIYNIGSCYHLNFGDSNQQRGYYTMINNEKPCFHANCQSIKFWRLYNEDIFDKKVIDDRDYVELYISQSNMNDQKYIERINEYTKQLKNIWIIPQTEEFIGEGMEKIEGYDIEKITRKLIPDELKEKFELIAKKIALK